MSDIKINNDLDTLIAKEDTANTGIKANPVLRFGYTSNAYENDNAQGVPSYSPSQQNNIPQTDNAVVGLNSSQLDSGAQTEFSSIGRNMINHFLGRSSYNLNKAHDFLSQLMKIVKELNSKSIKEFTVGDNYKVGELVYQIETVPEIVDDVTTYKYYFNVYACHTNISDATINNLDTHFNKSYNYDIIEQIKTDKMEKDYSNSTKPYFLELADLPISTPGNDKPTAIKKYSSTIYPGSASITVKTNALQLNDATTFLFIEMYYNTNANVAGYTFNFPFALPTDGIDPPVVFRTNNSTRGASCYVRDLSVSNVSNTGFTFYHDTNNGNRDYFFVFAPGEKLIPVAP